jgi:hypothetical protein
MAILLFFVDFKITKYISTVERRNFYLCSDGRTYTTATLDRLLSIMDRDIIVNS